MTSLFPENPVDRTPLLLPHLRLNVWLPARLVKRSSTSGPFCMMWVSHNGQLSPTNVFEDNLACIAMSTNPVRQKSSRHIDMRLHYCRELYTAGVMKLIPLRTYLMVADALTKSLPGSTLSKHRDIMMGHMPFFARLLHCGSQPFYYRFRHSAYASVTFHCFLVLKPLVSTAGSG